MSTVITDERADVASVLANKVRREIRDLLRNSDEHTLREIADSIGHSEQNTYFHLQQMLEANVVEKRKGKLNNRSVTFYTLSERYEELFTENEMDVEPIVGLIGLYLVLTLGLFAIPDIIMPMYGLFGVNTLIVAMRVNFMAILILSIPMLYYSIPNLKSGIKKVRTFVESRRN